MQMPVVTETSEIFVDDHGILHIRHRNPIEHTLEHARENVRMAHLVGGPVARRIVFDATLHARHTVEARQYYTGEEGTRYALAVAVVSNAVMGRVVADILLGLALRDVPGRLFRTVEDAVRWLLCQRVRV